jgi:hypothetical protein
MPHLYGGLRNLLRKSAVSLPRDAADLGKIIASKNLAA